MAGGGSPDFSAIILLCDSVACPEGKLYIQGGGWRTLQEDLPDAPGPARGCSPGHPGESAGRGQRQEVKSGYAGEAESPAGSPAGLAGETAGELCASGRGISQDPCVGLAAGQPLRGPQPGCGCGGPVDDGQHLARAGGPGGGQRVGGTGRGGMAAVPDGDRLCPGGAEHPDEPVQFRGGMGPRRPGGSWVAGERWLGYPR